MRIADAGHATNRGENESEIGALAVLGLRLGPDGRVALTLSVFGSSVVSTRR